MAAPDDAPDARLGARLRLERTRRGWSLADLAARSGVSRAMINRVERGEASPTAALLGRLSGAYGLTLSALLARAEGPSGRLQRVEDQARWRDPATGFVRRQIAPAPGSDFPLDLVGVVLPAGASVAFPAEAYAFVRQAVVVLEGALTVEEGGDTHALRPGDCLEFGPPSPCTFRAENGPCSYLVAAVRP